MKTHFKTIIIMEKNTVKNQLKDKDGKVIKAYDFVKDSEGNRYFINSHYQAVPEGDDAPAVELSSLIEKSEVTVLSSKEVLNFRDTVPTRGRGGRRRKEAPEVQKDENKPEEAAATAPSGELVPVDQMMLLSIFPDNVLADELRRRGYVLCAVRPALVEL